MYESRARRKVILIYAGTLNVLFRLKVGKCFGIIEWFSQEFVHQLQNVKTNLLLKQSVTIFLVLL